jgi:hypothetical protein
VLDDGLTPKDLLVVVPPVQQQEPHVEEGV